MLQGLLCAFLIFRGACSRTNRPPLAPQNTVRHIQCRQNPKVAHMAKVAFLGLGVMGFPMAGHLVAKGGHEVTVFNRTPAKAKAWAEKFGGKTAATPKAAAEGQDFVMCCVGNDNDLRAVTIGADGAFAGVKKGATFVDHTTASAEVARELDAAATKAGFKFIDAPVSGGQAGAENGVLTVMCGGSRRRLCRRRAGDRGLCADVQAARTGGLRATDKDGQPDLHRRTGPGPFGRHSFRQEGRARRPGRDRDHLEGRRAILADGKPLQDHERRQVRFRFCRGMDAQGSHRSVSRNRGATAPACR